MTERTKTLRVGAHRELPGLRAVGHHGRVAQDQTPARREVVLADAKGRLVELVEVRPPRKSKGTSEDIHEVAAAVIGKLTEEGALPGIGTRFGPWPARLHDTVVILGERELARLDRIARGSPRSEPSRIAALLRWLGQGASRSDELACERVEGLVTWYCSEEESLALWRRIQPIARQDLHAAARREDPHELRDASFWLSRTALADEDIYLAVTGLRRAGYPHWGIVLRQGIRDAPDEARYAGLEAAEKELSSLPVQACRDSIANRLRGPQRRHIDEAFEGLAA
ncbi:hypothetical protein WME76_45190 (plasmid) [Sorangium sp. So ce119]|uniref:hypothetical protein n=1 Tax=Sorangium sp. So ce119 TaxID=3133279 RepID=UPI003F6234A7